MELNNIAVAIIDDGINEDLYNLGNLNHNIEIKNDLSITKRADYDTYSPSHGTTCAAIIRKYTENVEFSSVKILNNSTLKSEKRQLIMAIDWCVENGIKIVNISLGTIDFRDFDDIKKCVNNAVERGLIIVAACSNKNVLTYPACLSNVIGVRSTSRYTGQQYKFVEYSFDGIDILASSNHYLVDVFQKTEYTAYCNSYATPMITGIICNLLRNKHNIMLQEIKKMLWERSISLFVNKYNPYLNINIDWIKGPILINICYEVEEAYSNLYCLNILNTLNITLNTSNNSKLATNIVNELSENYYQFKDIDNIIVAFSQNIDIKENYITSLLTYFNSINKNIVFLYEKESKQQYLLDIDDAKVKVWDTTLYGIYVKNHLRKEAELDIPVIYFNCYSWQKLIIVINEMNSLFKEDGYNSIGISNACRGIMLGLEYIPDGIDINRYLTSIYCKYNCDIIMIGIYDNNNESNDGVFKSLADISIHMKHYAIKITMENSEEIIGNFECDNSTKEIQRLYNSIKEYLM